MDKLVSSLLSTMAPSLCSIRTSLVRSECVQHGLAGLAGMGSQYAGLQERLTIHLGPSSSQTQLVNKELVKQRLTTNVLRHAPLLKFHTRTEPSCPPTRRRLPVWSNAAALILPALKELRDVRFQSEGVSFLGVGLFGFEAGSDKKDNVLTRKIWVSRHQEDRHSQKGNVPVYHCTTVHWGNLPKSFARIKQTE